ncbi:MAG TPA: COX15/CtaA family protein [Terriglobales bacterium]|nr:COX15/CtaA family protein [Terriglobales bacterium]
MAAWGRCFAKFSSNTGPKEYFLNSSPIPYNRAHHRFCVLVAGVTFLLLIAGALVTSNDAGLSVPDWPTSFGSLYKLPGMVGGVKFEHGHRMVAELVGLLTIILAVWTWRADRRGWVRKLGIAALATVIAQGVLGGITVLFYLPPAVSTAHATLAQTFFCIVVVLALVTSRGWTQAPPLQLPESHRLSLITLATLAAGSVYIQLILGAGFRHSGIKLLPHLVSAVVVTVLVLWTITRVLASYGSVAALRRPAVALMALLVTQLGLGFAAYLTRVQWGQQAVQPEMPMVVSTVAHVAVGALVLASAVVLALQTWRHMRPTQEQETFSASQLGKAVNA